MQEYKVIVGKFIPGTIRFYKPGTDILHRTDGPAVEYANGYKAWYVNGKYHREDGPAVEYTDGVVEYWINGKELTPAQFKKATAPKAKEMTIAEIEAALGHSVKVVK